MLALERDAVHSNGIDVKVGRSELRWDRATVLFVNSVGMACSLVDDAARLWIGAGFNFVTWELRGSPGASRYLGDCTLSAHAADAVEIVKHFGLGKLAVGGWCTGASIALALATSTDLDVSCMFLADGAFLFDKFPGAPVGNAMYAMCQEIVADPGRAERYHEVMSHRTNPGAAMGLEGHPGLVEEVTLPYRQDGRALCDYAWAVCGACAYEPMTVCQKVECPTLLTATADDTMVSYRNSERAQALMGDGRLEVSAIGGHYRLFTDLSRWQQIISFVKLHSSSRRAMGSGCRSSNKTEGGLSCPMI